MMIMMVIPSPLSRRMLGGYAPIVAVVLLVSCLLALQQHRGAWSDVTLA
jgi:hypothetical protein